MCKQYLYSVFFEYTILDSTQYLMFTYSAYWVDITYVYMVHNTYLEYLFSMQYLFRTLTEYTIPTQNYYSAYNIYLNDLLSTQ